MLSGSNKALIPTIVGAIVASGALEQGPEFITDFVAANPTWATLIVILLQGVLTWFSPKNR